MSITAFRRTVEFDYKIRHSMKNIYDEHNFLSESTMKLTVEKFHRRVSLQDKNADNCSRCDCSQKYRYSSWKCC